MIDELRVTAWLNPSEIDIGKHGKISNHEWLIKEKKRFNKDKIRCKIAAKKFKNPDGEIIIKEALYCSLGPGG